MAAFKENHGFVTKEYGRMGVGVGADLPAHSTHLNFLFAYYKHNFKTGLIYKNDGRSILQII